MVHINGSVSPKVSVCIPVYNCERFIGSAIESVLKQTFTDFELIILDNGSTDKTLDVVRQYKDSRLRLICSDKNYGAEENWNKALLEAKGNYIKILCADDILYPTCIEQQTAVYEDEDNRGAILVSCARDIINEQGKKILTRSFGNKHGLLSGENTIRGIVRAGTNLLGEPSAVLINAGLLDKNDRFDISIPYVIDVDFWCRLLLNGDAYVIGEPLCGFRVSSNTWSVNAARSQSIDFRRFIGRLNADRRFRVSFLDRTIGTARAALNGLLRQLFYKMTIKKNLKSART